MKKLVLFAAVALMAASASAQTVVGSKTFDNFYIGVNGGVATPTTGHSWMSDLNPNAGLRIGRYFTPVFGLAVEGNAYFSNKPAESWGTAVRFINTDLLATVNLSNWFGGYKGTPRVFELVAVGGAGWGHSFNSYGEKNINSAVAKAGLDFTFNLGEKKAWQLYVEPAIYHTLNGAGYEGMEYNINKSMVQLNAGIVYKFKNSNGTHNFAIAQLRDQSEIDALNAIINDLRNRKPEVVEKVVEKRVEVPAPVAEPKEVKVENLVFVTFAQGKSALTADAQKALNGVKEGAHVQIVGTASPEGSAELNQKLSQARADAVAEYLKGRGVVVDEATGKGVQGTTSNRLAVVYVK
ncbi:MAG: OmpA family protein [Prevotella sp.]|nr:OmpA family protein [Prevotella sp.]